MPDHNRPAFELTILGSSSATPTSTRNPTSQFLTISDRYMLIDCGEGTQMQLRRYKIKFQRIDHIFISHLHGDHYLGLPGLLASMHLLGRTKPLNLYAPPELQEILEVQHKHSETFLQFPIKFHALSFDKGRLLFEDERLRVDSIVLNHRIPCCGFLFREKEMPRKIKAEALKKYNIPLKNINGIKEGNDFKTGDGTVIPNAEITLDPPDPRSYAYCSDTIYDESLIEKLRGADLLYHEATFMNDMKERAKETYHSTASQAGTIAKRSKVKKLIIGHFSARYNDLDGLLSEARTVFKDTELALEGERFSP